MQLNSNVRINKLVIAVIISSLFGRTIADVVEPSEWKNVLDSSKKLIPQLRNGKDYSESVSFHLWTERNFEKPDQLKIGDPKTIKKSQYDSSKPTIVVIHGYLNSVYSDITQNIKSAALANYDMNVIGVDWSNYTMTPIYPSAVANVRGVGEHTARLVLFLMDETGMSAKNVHLIGHSLGAHVAGFCGKKLRDQGCKADRITGMDPALPGFYLAKPRDRLDSDDAYFVDCIHTACGTYGFVKPIGHADFYPNWGQLQPPCILRDIAGGVCSHTIVYKYYAESFYRNHIFEADTCDEWDRFNGNCQKSFMGYHAPRIPGIFYLKTNGSPPYAERINKRKTWSN